MAWGVSVAKVKIQFQNQIKDQRRNQLEHSNIAEKNILLMSCHLGQPWDSPSHRFIPSHVRKTRGPSPGPSPVAKMGRREVDRETPRSGAVRNIVRKDSDREKS